MSETWLDTESEAGVALRASATRYQRLLALTPDAIILCQEGKIIWANLAAAELFGVEHAAQLCGMTFMQFVLPEGHMLVEERLMQAAAGVRLSYAEQHLIGLDGRHIAVELAAGPFLLAGRPAVQVVIRDITDRKEAERALRESEHRRLAEAESFAAQVRRVMDTVPEGIVLLDQAFHVRLANPMAQEYLRCLTDDSAGPLQRLGDRQLGDLVSAATGGLAVWVDVAAGPGQYRYFRVALRSLNGRGSEDGWVLVLRDVTEERRMAEQLVQQERLAAIGRLAAGIAHTFNNLLTGIIGFADLLLTSPQLPEPLREDVRAIIQQGQRGARLVKRIMDFGGKSFTVMRPLAVQRLLEEAWERWAGKVRPGITIRLDLATDECTVQGDLSQLQQMVDNLIANAEDAMPHGGQITLGLRRLRVPDDSAPFIADLSPGDWCELTVADEGTGMSPEVQAHLFEPFFTTKGPELGSGLGLAQVYGIVRQHGGEIVVESEPGRGTSCRIYLPGA